MVKVSQFMSLALAHPLLNDIKGVWLTECVPVDDLIFPVGA
jgi:hypothetical protein